MNIKYMKTSLSSIIANKVPINVVPCYFSFKFRYFISIFFFRHELGVFSSFVLMKDKPSFPTV